MRGRVFLVALCALLAMAPMAAGENVLGDEALLALMLPGVRLAPADDFAYVITEPTPDGRYGPGTLVRMRETRPVEDGILCVAMVHGATHVEGYCGLMFAVYDPQIGALRGEPLRLGADKADYYLTYRDGVPGVLYIGSTAGQGIESYHGGMWLYSAGAWRMVWPVEDAGSEAYGDYWMHHKGVISYDPLAALEIYTREVGGHAEDFNDYHWVFEGYYEYGW